MEKIKWKRITKEEAILFFSDWFYEIKQAHWVALGVQSGYYTKDRVKYFSYKQSSPTVYDFHEGDVFYNQTGHALQVIDASPDLEVKLMTDERSIGYLIDSQQLRQWLEFGTPPDDSFRINKHQSKSDLAKFHEYTE